MVAKSKTGRVFMNYVQIGVLSSTFGVYSPIPNSIVMDPGNFHARNVFGDFERRVEIVDRYSM